MSIIKMLVLDEGLKLKPYRCTEGKLTIGIGRNLDDNGISEEEAYAMCRADVRTAEVELMRCQHRHTYGALDEVRKFAIINMAYNMGVPSLMGFKKMWAALDAGLFETAANEAQDSKWFYQVGERGPRIVSVIRTGTLEAYGL